MKSTSACLALILTSVLPSPLRLGSANLAGDSRLAATVDALRRLLRSGGMPGNKSQ